MKIDKDIHETMSERWDFNANVVEVFEDMLSRSIPQIYDMRNLVTDYALEFVKPGSVIMDLGSSKGGSVDPIINVYGGLCKYILVENSEPMYAFLRNKYHSNKKVDCFRLNLDDTYPQYKNDLTMAVLTIQFTKPEERSRIIADVYKNLNDGGAFILVEKTKSEWPEFQDIQTKLYEKMKAQNGYSKEEIEQKKNRLDGFLKPLHSCYYDAILEKVGFMHVEQVWRWNQFVMWVAIK